MKKIVALPFVILFFCNLHADDVDVEEPESLFVDEEAVSLKLDGAFGEIARNDEKSSVKAVFNEEYLPELLSMLNSAKREVLFAQFEFHPDPTVDKVCRALRTLAGKGVKIRGVVERSLQFNEEGIKRIAHPNVQVRFGAPDKYVHCKMFIVDDEPVLLGSTNLSFRSMLDNNETNVMIKSATINAFYRKYFEELWTSPDQDVKLPVSGTANLLPLPDRSLYDMLYSMLNNASERIYILMFGTRLHVDGDLSVIAGLLSDKKKAGLDVRVVLEKSLYDEKLNKFNEELAGHLRKVSVPVSFDRAERITHAKMCIIDGSVIIGSANWSAGGFSVYHEANIVVNDSDVLKRSLKYFDDVLSHRL